MLQLLKNLFNRSVSDSENSRRFWSSRRTISDLEARIITEIKAYYHSLFRTLNAIEIDMPILTPSSDPLPQSVQVLDASGMPLLLPFSLLRLMRATLPCVQSATVIRRFALESVYHENTPTPARVNSSSTTPTADLRASFDCVVNYAKLRKRNNPEGKRNRPIHLNHITDGSIHTIFIMEPIKILWLTAQVFQPWIGM